MDSQKEISVREAREWVRSVLLDILNTRDLIGLDKMLNSPENEKYKILDSFRPKSNPEYCAIIQKYEEKIKYLEEQVKELKQIPKHGDKLWLRDIVFQDTGKKLLRATPEQINEAKMNAILARDHQIDVKENIFKDNDGNPRKRYNECGNDMEIVLKVSSNGKLSGLGQATGYPDLINEKAEYYLECKVADFKSMDTSFRSFYISTLKKIKKSQAHLLVCFKHHDGKLSKDDEPIIIDLYDLELTLKQEWNTSNKILYNVFKPPDYTKEDLDKILNDNTNSRGEKKEKIKEICKKHNVKTGGKGSSPEGLCERLIDYLKDFNGIE